MGIEVFRDIRDQSFQNSRGHLPVERGHSLRIHYQ